MLWLLRRIRGPAQKKGAVMKIGKLSVRIFRIKNRKGYAAICADHLTEGKTPAQAHERMVKAVRRTTRRKK